MTRNEFSALTRNQQGAISNYMAAARSLRRALPRTLFGVFFLVFGIWMGSSQNPHAEREDLAILLIFFSKGLMVVCGLMTLLLLIMHIRDYRDLRKYRQILISMGIQPDQLKGLREEDILELLLVPTLMEQGLTIVPEEPYGNAR